MPHPAVLSALRTLLPAFALAGGTIAACKGAEETPAVDTASSGATAAARSLPACSPPWTGRIETIRRDTILAWARGLAYSAWDTSRARLYGFGAAATAEMHLVAGLRADGICLPIGGGCIIARVVTKAAQARLGIAVGTNYVWADSVGGSARAVIIPENPAAPVVAHRLRHHPFRLGAAVPVRLIGPGGCGWCGDTCWCDWPMDTIAASILELPRDTGRVLPRDTGLRGAPPR